MKDIHSERVIESLCQFIRVQVRNAGRQTAIVGVSGGVDSAVACALAAKALGPENVWAVKMPYRTSSNSSIEDADALIDQIGVYAVTISITPMVEAYSEGRNLSPVRLGNVMARCRMIVLYDMAAEQNGLVVGTGNRTECVLGYTTLHGDSACDFNPLGDLWKTQVWQLAAALGVPQTIIDKPPSADLWMGQTDEKEIGVTYKELDEVLSAMNDRHWSVDQIIEAGHAVETVDRIMERIRNNLHKSQLPPVAMLTTQEKGL